MAPSGNATEIADLFEYSIRNPVTVKKNESAMLPFLQQKIAARKLIIYSDHSKPNPLSAAELTNNTGRTLDGGPITVYDAGAYAGEALVETIKNDDKRFISYGVDLGTRISTNQNSRNEQRPRTACAQRPADHQLRSGAEKDLCDPQCGRARQDADHRTSGPLRFSPDRHR